MSVAHIVAFYAYRAGLANGQRRIGLDNIAHCYAWAASGLCTNPVQYLNFGV